MTLELNKILLYSELDTLKNYASVGNSVNIPSQSYAAGSFRTFTLTLPLDRTDALAQIYVTYSFDSTKTYVGTLTQVNVNANFFVQSRASLAGSTYTVNFYVVNQTGSTQTVPAFTATVDIRRFVSPFN
jgi:hypothetical protein